MKISAKEVQYALWINDVLLHEVKHRYQNLDANYQVLDVGDKVKPTEKCLDLDKNKIYTISRYVFGSEIAHISNKDLDDVVVYLELAETGDRRWAGEYLEKIQPEV